MTDEIAELARLFGADIVGQVPDVGGGVLGAAHLAKIYQDRMQRIHDQDQELASKSGDSQILPVPLSGAAAKALADLAEVASTETSRLSPVQVASGLLEDAATLWIDELRKVQSELQQAEDKQAVARRAYLSALQRLTGVAIKEKPATQRIETGR